MKLRIREVVVDGHNGHLSIHAHIEDEKDGHTKQGAVETYGIDPPALDRRFSGDVRAWLKYVGLLMKDNHCRRTAIHSDAQSLVGKTIDLD